jgi:cystathionine beta-synthase
MKNLSDGIDFSKQEISAVMGKPLPQLSDDTDISEAYRLLLAGNSGIIALNDSGVPSAILTRSDIIDYLITQKEGHIYEI